MMLATTPAPTVRPPSRIAKRSFSSIAIGTIRCTSMAMLSPGLLGVAEAMLNGELEYRKGNHDAAFAHLRRAVELSDTLPYDEPWGWMQPARHALGALLLEQGRVEEAEAVYRSDLGLDGKLSRACQHPDNLWSLQ